MKKILFVAILVTSQLACSSEQVKFTDYKSFYEASDDVQLDTIDSILIANNYIVHAEELERINFILDRHGGPNDYPLKWIQSENYDGFLDRAVPSIYFSYTPVRLREAPENKFNDAVKFASRIIPYEYTYGEAKFREYVTEEVNQFNELMFRTVYLEETLKIEEIHKRESILYSSPINNLTTLIHIKAWTSEYFNLTDFKRLHVSDQANILYNILYLSDGLSVSKDLSEQDIVDFVLNEGKPWNRLSLFEELWYANSEDYLNSMELPDSANIMEVYNSVLDLIFSE